MIPETTTANNPVPEGMSMLNLPRVKSGNTSLDAGFLRDLAGRFGLRAFVETGTYLGGTAEVAATVFDEVHTIELSPELARQAAERLAPKKNVQVYQGDSAKILPQILAQVKVPTLFWLDGHYSEGTTAKGESNTPILEELKAILSTKRQDLVLLVDDLQLFERSTSQRVLPGSLSGYPSAVDLYRVFSSNDYQFFVLGDVGIAFHSQTQCEVSPLIMALTISRLYDGTNLPIEEVIEAEKVIVQTGEKEREEFRRLSLLHGSFESHGLGLHYRFWHALSLVGENKLVEAADQLVQTSEFGFSHWRLKWYLALIMQQLGQLELVQQLVTEVLQVVPAFVPAQQLVNKKAPAKTATQPSHSRPMLPSGSDAIPVLQAAGLYSPGKPLKLHLGCGENHFNGYVNIDFPPSEHSVQTRIGADAFADITKLAFPSGSLQEIRSHHVFEHFTRPDSLGLLILWQEMLQVGGKLHIETPDVMGCAEQLVSNVPYRQKQAVLRHCFGSHEAHWANHYEGWHAEKFQQVLSRLGFTVECRRWRWPHDPYLANVEAFATKTKEMTREGLLAAADAILEESMLAEVASERAMWEVWRKAMRDFINRAQPQGAVQSPTKEPAASAPVKKWSERLAGVTIRPNSPEETSCGFDNDNPATNGEYRLLRTLLQPGDRVFDVGANVGDWSRQALTVYKIQLHAFEPFPQTYKTLQQVLSGANVTLHQVALSDTTGQRSFFYYPEGGDLSGMNSLYRRPEIEARLKKNVQTTNVPTETLDNFCATTGLAKIDFLKLDVEGAELAVLRGAQELLRQNRIGFMQFEYGGTWRDAGVTLKEAFHLLTGFGYTVYRIVSEGLIQINEWNDSLENYRYSNYLAAAKPEMVLSSSASSEQPACSGEIVVKLQGGLGNQMFQYAAGLALARRAHAKLKLDLGFLLDRTPRPNFTYRDYCLDLFRLAPDCELLQDGAHLATRLTCKVEEQFHFDPQFLALGKNVYLDGYFQSPRFFEEVLEEVRQTFTSFVAPLTPKQQELYDKISNCNAVCLNVRRGDYVANPVTNSFHGVCDESYFQQAVSWICEHVANPHFFIFSDDVEWCRSAKLVGDA
ncbi:MAG TPA: FkbM family methyltransferase, partial [Clostridia bacterium]|nr:FkbM family methyltransferase [Clostridia bacterium]